MSLPDPKELKKLADACRKAGISRFKSGDFEFTLSEEKPQSNYKKRQAKKSPVSSSPMNIETDELSEEALLMWSVAGASTEESST